MAVRPCYIKHEENLKPVPRELSPVVTLLYISGQGIVFKSRRPFDTGTKLAIGLHLDKIRQDLGVSKSGQLFDLNSFINAQGFVADCKLMEASPIGAAYQVTLLFDQLDAPEQMLVEAIEREVRLLKKLTSNKQAPVLPQPPGLN
jgi:hypothetical protein